MFHNEGAYALQNSLRYAFRVRVDVGADVSDPRHLRDSSGLAIPSVTVKATQTATGVSRNTTTGIDGGYVLTTLPVGPYLLEVAQEGFTNYVRSGIVLQIDTQPTIDVTMQLGSVSEQVTVEANALQVETRSTSVGAVVDNKQIMEMPLNGRDTHELVFLAGMAVNPGDGSMNSIRNYPTVVVSVAGGNGDGVAYIWMASSTRILTTA